MASPWSKPSDPICKDCGFPHKPVETCCPLTLYMAGPVLSDYMLVDHTGLSIDFESVKIDGKAGHLSTVALVLPWGQCKIVAGPPPADIRETAYCLREGSKPSYTALQKRVVELEAEVKQLRMNPPPVPTLMQTYHPGRFPGDYNEHVVLDPNK